MKRRRKVSSAAARTLPLFVEEPQAEKAARVAPTKSNVSYAAFLVKGGLVETTALKHFVRFGRWPEFFLQMVGYVVPERLTRRGEELRRAEGL